VVDWKAGKSANVDPIQLTLLSFDDVSSISQALVRAIGFRLAAGRPSDHPGALPARGDRSMSLIMRAGERLRHATMSTISTEAGGVLQAMVPGGELRIPRKMKSAKSNELESLATHAPDSDLIH